MFYPATSLTQDTWMMFASNYSMPEIPTNKTLPEINRPKRSYISQASKVKSDTAQS